MIPTTNTNKPRFGILALALAGAAAYSLTGTAAAHEGVVLGLGMGGAEQQIEQSDFPGADLDNEDIALKTYLGFRSGMGIGVNFGYVDFGEVEIRDSTAFARAESSAWFTDLELGLPLTPYWSLFGKVGLVAWDQQTEDNTLGFVKHTSESGTGALWGAGMRFNFGDFMAWKLEFERYEFDDDYRNFLADYEVTSFGVEIML